MELLHAVALFYLLAVETVSGQATNSLPTLNIQNKLITLSGYSSGGAMAQHLLVAYSATIHGVASFSNPFYRCGPANGVYDDYISICTSKNPGLYDTKLVHADIKNYYSKGLIDDPANLKGRRLYLYGGLRNGFFSILQQLAALKVFERYIKNANKIATHVQDSELVLPTDNTLGGLCRKNAKAHYFIGNCGYSGAFESIHFLLGSDTFIKKPLNLAGEQLTDQRYKLKVMDQTAFTKGLKYAQMDTIGYYYVPKNCERKFKCLLHVYFHGCLSGREFIGTNQITKSGFLEVAEANDIIMLFPQAKSSSKNEVGCWDVFGVGGPNYATKEGHQVTAVKRMINKVSGFRDELEKRDLLVNAFHQSEGLMNNTMPRL